MENKVKAWLEEVSIPTYEIGEPEKNPIFLEKRVYQGSSGAVYPHPVIEKISDEKTDKIWKALYLENDYLKIMILPELGGRIQMAYDKSKERHFVYYNSVIKPALVGLTGPWISGGIEFNWPQHHRPSTYDPVDYLIEENEDGSKTVWCSEIERMFRTKGMTGFTLHPEKAYLEIKVRLYNRTSMPQTFLWWANPAVKVNDHYQSVFPPDVNAVFDHGKRDVSKFPVASGTYYKVDYSAGVDISKYKNIPVPTSYMSMKSDYNFVGGYENDTKGGLLHVANHHVSPGKKQWTWGNGDFGQAWDRNLTDSDGPYIELMCGVYTDNQPDFSWLMPYEEKAFSQYFLPYRDLGVLKNATKEALLNLEFDGNKAKIKIFTTAKYPNTKIVFYNKNHAVVKDSFDFKPDLSYEKSIELEGAVIPHDYSISVISEEGKVLVSWKPEKEEIRPIPEPARAAMEPKDIKSIEELYLTGLHLEQYRHATYDPTLYYMEALEREEGDIRNNNAMGLWLLRKGQFRKSEQHFRRAIKTLTNRNPNPYDGEPYFNLGLSLRFQYKYDDAYEAFYKSTWNNAWRDAGYFNLAQLACHKENWVEAKEHAEFSLTHNWKNHKTRHLLTAILRKDNKKEEALRLLKESLNIDKFNFGALFEEYLITEDEGTFEKLKSLMRSNVHSYIEISLDYALAGLLEEAQSLLNIVVDEMEGVYPMVYYFFGWYAFQSGNTVKANEYFKLAETMDSSYCFPNKIEEILALQCAINQNPTASKANYYIGNFWYAGKQYSKAVEHWELSKKLDLSFPTVRRNLSLAYYNKLSESELAVAEMEAAFKLDNTDARVFMELDQLYKKLGKSHNYRLERLEKHAELVEQRDDLYLEYISLQNFLGKHERALSLIMNRKFHPWEGGEGKVTEQYLFANIELAKKLLTNQEFSSALEFLKAAECYPENLGEGKLYGTQENDIHYWMGCVYSGLGDKQKAIQYWEKASAGLDTPTAAMFYNDQNPDKIFYQGLACIKLGSSDAAKSRFNKLKNYGEEHLFDEVKIDYFAVSLPDLLIWEDDLQERNTIHCKYLIGLGYLGLGELSKAKQFLSTILESDPYHIGGHAHFALADFKGIFNQV